MSPCDGVRHAIGGYVLGGLDPDERLVVADHLDACDACAAEHAELADVPALLELTRPPAPTVPSRLRDRVIADAARRRARRGWTVAAAAAAMLAALVGFGTGRALAPDAPPTFVVALESEAAFADASGLLTIRDEPRGVVVSLEATQLAPLPDPKVYEAWLYTDAGEVVSIGQLDVDDGDLAVELTASGSLDDYRGFWVTAEPDRHDPAHDGQTVLRARLP